LIGYAHLARELSYAGTRLELEVFGERVPAEITADVLYDPQSRRVMA